MNGLRRDRERSKRSRCGCGALARLPWLAPLSVLVPVVATAHPVAELDPFGKAERLGLAIQELKAVEVAIYGSSHFNVADVVKGTVRMGTRDDLGAPAHEASWRDIDRHGHAAKRRRARHDEGAWARTASRRDIDGDGIEDLLLWFDVARTGLIESRESEAIPRCACARTASRPRTPCI